MNQTNVQAIQTLRRETKAGIVDCKNALHQAGGNIEEARALLLQKGFQIAEKKAERVAADGVAYATVIDGAAILLEVNTETDFVAANGDFLAHVHTVAEAIAAHRPADVPELLRATMPGTGETVTELLQRVTLAFREKIVLRRFAVLEGAMATAYTHLNGQYGVILTLAAEGDVAPEQWQPVGKELALHIAACAPRYVSREAIGVAERRRVEAELAAEMEQDAAVCAKPPEIRAKILAGRIEKFYRTSCLLEQPYVKDPERTVREHLRVATAGWGATATVGGFHRYQKAEGLQVDDAQGNLAYARQMGTAAAG